MYLLWNLDYNYYVLKVFFAMIVPYPLTNQKYGKKLRKMLAEEYRLLR